MMKIFGWLGVGVVSVAGLWSWAWGQEGEVEKKPEVRKREVRVWAVGDMPPFRHEIRGGVAYEIEPSEGSLPPRELAVVGAEGEELGKLRVNLGRPTVGVALGAGEGPWILRDVASAVDWHRFAAPEAGDFTLLCWRGGGKAGWSEPGVMVLGEGTGVEQSGRLRLVNVSGVKLAVVLGKEKLQVEGRKVVERKYEKAEELALQVGLADGKGVLRRIHSSGLAVDPREKTTVVIYRTDGQEVRRPVKVLVVREAVVKE